MPSILIPPDKPNPLRSDPEEDRQLALWAAKDSVDADLLPHLLIQLEDDLERSLLREAYWISVVVHIALVIFLLMSPKMFPGIKGVTLLSPADLMRNQELTYLDLPPDAQKQLKASREAKVISDKNRIAESRHPSLDKKTLEELKRAGPPAPPAAPGQTAQMSPPMQQGQQQQPDQSQGQQMAQLQPIPDPKLATPPQGAAKFPGNLGGMMSPGSAIEQAARAVATHRGGGTYGGGDYGAGQGGPARTLGNLEVLSDTQGVDFGPYLSRVVDAVRRNWYTIIPEAARAPLLKRGKVAIEFAILPDGKVAGMRITG